MLTLDLAGRTMEQMFRVLKNCSQDGILGYDCIKQCGPVMLDVCSKRLKIGSQYVPIEHSRTPPLKMIAVGQLSIPSRTMAVVYGKTNIPLGPGQSLVFEQDPSKYDQFLSPRTVLTAAA
jgi:hypothetical protein